MTVKEEVTPEEIEEPPKLQSAKKIKKKKKSSSEGTRKKIPEVKKEENKLSKEDNSNHSDSSFDAEGILESIENDSKKLESDAHADRSVTPRQLPTQVTPRPPPTQVTPRPLPTPVTPRPLPTQDTPRPLPTQVTPRPLPAGISVADIGIGDCSVQLDRRKDLMSPDRVERAQRICRLLNVRLRELFPAASTNKPRVVIHAMVVLASEGSRLGRFCCAEFGVGLAKLGVTWVLASSTDSYHSNDCETLFLGKSPYKISSAGCGFADIFQNDAGDQALEMMTEAVVWDIFRKVKAHTNH
jgi:hypothetical protein